MIKAIIRSILMDVVGPLGRRAGSLLGGLLVGFDLAPDKVIAGETAVAVLVGVFFDLMLAKVDRNTLFLKPPVKRKVL